MRVGRTSPLGSPLRETPILPILVRRPCDSAAVGVTLFAAAGDNGSADNVQDGYTFATFPAASPYAVSVGGTTITTTSEGAWSGERVWNDTTTRDGFLSLSNERGGVGS